MNDVGFTLGPGRGFMRSGLGFVDSDGTFSVHFARSAGSWSPAAIAAYESFRSTALGIFADAVARGLGKLVLAESELYLARAGDSRPGWLFEEQEAVVDILTARIVERSVGRE